jgi:hypothetical protein
MNILIKLMSIVSLVIAPTLADMSATPTTPAATHTIETTPAVSTTPADTVTINSTTTADTAPIQ